MRLELTSNTSKSFSSNESKSGKIPAFKQRGGGRVEQNQMLSSVYPNA